MQRVPSTDRFLALSVQFQGRFTATAAQVPEKGSVESQKNLLMNYIEHKCTDIDTTPVRIHQSEPWDRNRTTTSYNLKQTHNQRECELDI